jgi:hypothetical protein
VASYDRCVRLLFLAGRDPDYLQDALYHGLVTLLGAGNVVDHPENERYHGTVPADSRVPMLSFDFPRVARPELRELVASVDAIVICSLRDSVIDEVRRVLELAPTKLVAFVDGEDHPYVRGIASSVDVYFKRETLRRSARLRARMPARRLYHRRRYPQWWGDPLRREVAVASARSRNVVPLPFGIIDTGFQPTAEKDIDIAFLASATSPERARVADALRELERDGVTVRSASDLSPGSRLAWSDYIELLSRSRIGVSVRGLGYDTYRYWEIPYAGALLLSEPTRTVIPDNFVDGHEAFFAPVERLAERARELLSGDTRDVAEAGRRKLLAHHTSVHRARSVLDRLEAPA